jgi:ABC-2 type transport system permease protein
MSVTTFTRPPRPQSALRRLIATEARLLLREPLALFWGLAFPIGLMIVMGLLAPVPQRGLGGLRLVDVYEPVVIAFVIAVLALQGMPTVLVNYRERGILRRLATTPVGPVRILAAQLSVNVAVALTTTAGIIAVGALGFDIALPRHLPGFLAALVLLISAMLTIGLVVAALAPTARSASVIGAALFFLMMFFAGLWVPRALMPHALLQVSDYTPLGAAVRAVQDSVFGGGPALSTLAVLAGYAVAGAVLAARFFRWP